MKKLEKLVGEEAPLVRSRPKTGNKNLQALVDDLK